MDSKELKDRIETIFFVSNMAFLGYQRYIKILSDPKIFACVFGGTPSDNPKINHILDKDDVIFTTTKNEILNDANHDLFKAWQIAFCIIGMSSIFEQYLSSVIEKVTGKKFEGMGAFTQFRKLTGIKLSESKDFLELREYHEVRNITVHNLARENERFLKKIQSNNPKDSPHVFYPKNMKVFKDLIFSMVDYIESKI